MSLSNISNITDLLNAKFKVYSYITKDYEPGTLIVHSDLSAIFDSQLLFEMEKSTVCELTLMDILEKGFIKIGDTDLMEKMDISYPVIPNETYKSNKIIGKHMYVKSADIMSRLSGCEFDIDAENDCSSHDSFDGMSDSISGDVIDINEEPLDVEPLDVESCNIEVQLYNKIDTVFRELDGSDIIKDVTDLLNTF